MQSLPKSEPPIFLSYKFIKVRHFKKKTSRQLYYVNPSFVFTFAKVYNAFECRQCPQCEPCANK